MLQENAICLLQTQSSIYPDQVLPNNQFKYYTSRQGRGTHYIQPGAHYFTRKKTGPYTYMGRIDKIISTGNDILDNKPILYKIITIRPIPSLRGLLPKQIVPKYNPNPNRGRGHCAYNRDAAYHSGIDVLKVSPFRGILYGKQVIDPWKEIDEYIRKHPPMETTPLQWEQVDRDI